MRCVCVHSLIPLVRSLHAPRTVLLAPRVRVLRTVSEIE